MSVKTIHFLGYHHLRGLSCPQISWASPTHRVRQIGGARVQGLFHGAAVLLVQQLPTEEMTWASCLVNPSIIPWSSSMFLCFFSIFYIYKFIYKLNHPAIGVPPWLWKPLSFYSIGWLFVGSPHWIIHILVGDVYLYWYNKSFHLILVGFSWDFPFLDHDNPQFLLGSIIPYNHQPSRV